MNQSKTLALSLVEVFKGSFVILLKQYASGSFLDLSFIASSQSVQTANVLQIFVLTPSWNLMMFAC